MKTILKRTMLLAVTACSLVAGMAMSQTPNEQFVPVMVFRTGAYAPNGVPWANGFVDYLKLVNERDGGINGVKITYEECETAYAADRGVECYERLKAKGPTGATGFNPLSTGITFAITDKAPNDKVVIFTTGYGRSESVDGSVFGWNFPFMGTYWDAADILVQHVAKKGSLKGKKIALIYHDSPFGKEPIPVLEEHAKKHGFELLKLPVTHPGLEQKATWLQVRQQKPDYVFLWGWGGMNSTALKEAIAVSYPRLQMYGVWWSAAEPDTTPAGEAAKGYNGLALQHSNEKDAPVHKDMKKFVLDKGKATGPKEELGSVLYNRGMISAMLVVESVRQAQSKFGKKPMTGEQVRWGAEHLNIDNARIKAMGFESVMQPIKTSCTDHGGGHRARIHTWDGTQWSYTSDWYESDQKMLRPMIEAAAKKYADEKKITPRDCKKEG